MFDRKNAFAGLQKVGKSLMLPVSVLPVAGILLGVGAADFSWIPHIFSEIMEQAGSAVFDKRRDSLPAVISSKCLDCRPRPLRSGIRPNLKTGPSWAGL